MAGLCKLSSVVLKPNRQRREFSPTEINELADSIEANGLLHAPVIRFEGDTPVLVAGERRFRAISDLYELGRLFKYNNELVPLGMLPCTSLGDLPLLEAWEAELEENIRRVDLTWQEKAAATSELMALRKAQAADKGAPTPTVRDLVAEVRPNDVYEQAHITTRKEILVSSFLDDKEIAAAPTLKEAVKILKKREERRQQAELATITGASFSASLHQLLHVDAAAWCATAEPSQFDIVLTDPPYGMGADQFGDSGVGSSAAAHFYDDSYEAWQAIMQWFPRESFRLAKAEAHLYAFCDFDRFHEFRGLMQAAGWKVHRTPLVWNNPDGFRAPWPDQGCQRKYELILYAVKGDRKVNQLKGDVLEYSKDKAAGHPAQKPVALLVDLLKRSAKAGNAVWDPFAGSFSTVEACNELKLSCTALERDASAYGIGVKRVTELAELEKELF
jgi:DNA modification methylase/ParB-like chromosome segregation protein Spo0J